MSRQLYFVCATPGTTGNFIGKMIKSAIGDTNMSLTHSFSQPLTGELTLEFFFDNIEVPESGNIVINSPFRPDYTRIFSRFPDCKIVVVSHNLNDCTHIAKSFFKSYYINTYEYGAEEHFRTILTANPHLFKNVNAAPLELTPKEQLIFIKMLAHQKLMDGFHSLDIPENTNVLEIAFTDIHYNTSQVETQLEQFIGTTFSASEKELNKEFTEHFIKEYFRATKDTPVL
jgi:hypothetical protein